MNDWETQSLQKQLDRLNKKIWKDSATHYIWLIILSNIIFWLVIDYNSLKNCGCTKESGQKHAVKTSEINKQERESLKGRT